MQLLIGDKNYSSWSMRPWVLMRAAGIDFEERWLRFDGGFGAESPFKREISALSPAGRVPVLVTDEGVAVWDSLAIAETLAERFADRGLWPAEPGARARARSVCAEMHAGFGALRKHCPMNIVAELPEVGARLMATEPGVRADLQRITSLWDELLLQHRGPWLFGERTGIADAFFAPVCSRIRTYGLPVSPTSADYVQRMLGSPAVVAWSDAARAEFQFLDFEEPYRTAP
jgi:glutathione S-transferase